MNWYDEIIQIDWHDVVITLKPFRVQIGRLLLYLYIGDVGLEMHVFGRVKVYSS